MKHQQTLFAFALLQSLTSPFHSQHQSHIFKFLNPANASSNKRTLTSNLQQRREKLLKQKRRDKFVTSSPLIVAAVGIDGVALVALHVSAEHEPLLFENYYEGNKRSDLSTGKDEEEGTAISSTFPLLQDLPSSFRGPFRIQMVDSAKSMSSSMVSCGWRTDCMAMSSRCRSLASSIVSKYYGNDNAVGRGEDFGRYLAESLSMYLARCSFSESVRSLSSVSLLATTHCNNIMQSHQNDSEPASTIRKRNTSNRLYVIDETGFYRVRAHALGHGSDLINKRMMHVDFAKLSVTECVSVLLNLIVEEAGMKEVEGNAGCKNDQRKLREEKVRDGSEWKLPNHKTFVELAIMDSKGFRRLSNNDV